MRIPAISAMCALALALASSTAFAADPSLPFTKAAFDEAKGQKAVILVSANWARRWKCGAFENAQLQLLGFDRVGNERASATDKPDVILEDSSLLPASQAFVNYALIVEPGEYLFSAYRIKAAKSLSQVGTFESDRSTLISDAKSKAGSFTANAGEVVYIGHFALDCARAPMPWRYYPEDKPSFAKYLEVVAREYPGLPTQEAKFRLFQTSLLGSPFTLE